MTTNPDYKRRLFNKKNILLAFIAFALLNNFSNATLLEDSNAFQQILPLYSISPENSQTTISPNLVYHLEQLRSSAYGKLKDFTSEARLTFKTEKQQLLAATRTFTLRPTTPLLSSEWRNKNLLYIWNRGSAIEASPLKLPLIPEKGEKGFLLGKYDEFWFDYTSVGDVPLCMPLIEFNGVVRPYAGDNRAPHNFVMHTRTTYPLKTIATINVSPNNWIKKDSSYLIRRTLGIAPDENWRYVQDSRNTVIQRRMHVLLDKIEAIDLVFSPRISIAGINLLVSHNDNYKTGQLIKFTDLLQKLTLPDGQAAVRLNLREALMNHFTKEWSKNAKEPGKHHFYLQEVIIFIPGNEQSIAAAMPVRSLIFRGQDQDVKSLSQQQFLPTKVIDVNAQHQRLMVNFDKLLRKGKVTLRNAVLRLLPPPHVTSCAIHINGMQVVSIYNNDVPVFVNRLEDLSRHLEGILSITPKQYDTVNNPGIIGYLPLSTLATTAAQQGMGSISSSVENKKPRSPLYPLQDQILPYRIIGENKKPIIPDWTRLISSGGTVLLLDGSMNQATSENELLVLEGQSRELEITWPLNKQINEKTLFYFGVDEGVEQIYGIRLTLILTDGSIIQRRILPNKPIHLVTKKVELESVKLHIRPTVIPFRFKFREMTFFSPNTVSYAEAFTVPLPTPYKVLPEPVLEPGHMPVLEVHPGQIMGLTTDLVEDKPLRFSTPIVPPLDWVHGIRFKYHIPLSFSDNDTCLLSLQFNWDNDKTERELCFDNPHGDLFIPMTNWLGENEKLKNMGKLHSIDWTLRLPKTFDMDLTKAFNLQFAVEGWAMLSAADHLHFSPLFYAGYYPIFADFDHANKSTMGHYEPRILLPLKKHALSRIIAANGNIRPVKHELFSLEQVYIKPKFHLSQEQWQKLVEIPAIYVPPRWPRWLFWASAILLTWASWEKGWWSASNLLALGNDRLKLLFYTLLWILNFVVQRIWKALPLLNVLLGVMAFVPGVWLAGELGFSLSGVTLLFSVGLVVWGAYCHCYEYMVQNRQSGGISLHLRYGALVVALGFAIWSLGYYKLSIESLWGFLPLFGAIYALLPIFYNLLRQLILRNHHYASFGGWLIFTIILYGLGWLNKPDGGVNYLFTFGALTAVFALRAGMLLFEVRLRQFFPVIAEHVYTGAGNIYFSIGLVSLIATAVMLTIKLESIAEQFAVIVYYCIVLGLLKDAMVLYRSIQTNKN